MSDKKDDNCINLFGGQLDNAPEGVSLEEQRKKRRKSKGLLTGKEEPEGI